MQLVDNWRAVLKHAWSVRLNAFLLLLIGLDASWPFLDGLIPVPRWVFAALTAPVAIAAIVARFTFQRKINGVSNEPSA